MGNQRNITIHKSDISDVDMDQPKYEIKKEIDNKVKRVVVNRILETKLNGTLRSISEVSYSQISWDPHDKFRNSPSNLMSRFPIHQYAKVKPEEMVEFHNDIGHSVEHTSDNSIQGVADKIKNSENNIDIPTPPLAYKPVNLGDYPGLDNVSKIEYEPIFEGRTRSAGSRRAGLNRMPVLVTARRIKR